jgi:hypothetical protein
MLNRTNLTLSARTLSNRLNLGTRSLALGVGVHHGNPVARIRQSHQDAMREGMVWYDAFSIKSTRCGIPASPRSPFRSLAKPGLKPPAGAALRHPAARLAANVGI